jgi:hypothetical protein
MHTNSPEIKQFIRENASLFWYIREDAKENISHEVLVEFILNYGDENSVKKLFDLLGIEKVAEIFYKQTHKEHPIERNRINYFPLVRNFFDLYFKKNNAYRNIIGGTEKSPSTY